MPRSSTSLALAASFLSSALAAQETEPPGPQPTPSTSPVGNRCSFELKYSNQWSEVALRPREPGKLPTSPEGLIVSRAIDRIEAIPIGQDPLFVDLTLSLGVRESGGYELCTDVAEVRYLDDRGRRWALSRGAKGIREVAIRTLDEVAGQWRSVFPSSLEAEMLEEQLVGAAIFLLSSISFQAEVDAPSGDASLPGFEIQAREKLPASFPPAVLKPLEWFYREAVARVTGPKVEDARPGMEITRRGMTFTVEKARTGRTAALVQISGQKHWQATGVALKEAATIEARTGLTVESRSVTVRDALRGRNARFGAVRWQVKMLQAAPVKGAASRG